MISIRFHGRGGQGVVTSSEILAVAVSYDGKYAQAMPAFGPERTLAPVISFCRINNKPIQTYQEVYKPDVVVILDQSLLDVVDVTAGLKEKGIIIMNSKGKKEFKGFKIYDIDALSIAKKHLGRPYVNTAILGALAKITGIVSLKSLEKAIIHRFGEKKGRGNVKAAEECYKLLEKV